ncbi:peptidase S8/S53 domain-containing protein [Mycena leptocephala]|nr:peptidase S8/S53 domain-containing protein [Mycena leptocephala]
MPNSTIAHVPDEIPDQYIVTFDTSADLGAHLTQLQDFINANKNCTTLNNTVDTKDDYSFIKFYAGTFDGRVMGFISKAQGVQSIERSRLVTDQSPDGSRPPVTSSRSSLERRRSGAPWNLERISHGGNPLSSGPSPGPKSATSQDWTYFAGDRADGEGVAIYIVDTGIKATHPEIAQNVKSVGDDFLVHSVPGSMDDTNGHGTAVASVAAGATVGVANKATLFPMRVLTEYTDLDSTAQSILKSKLTFQSVSEGIINVVEHYEQVWNGGRTSGVMKPAIINLSISMWKDGFFRTAVEAAIKAGIHVVIAAGNSNVDWCKYYLPSDIGHIVVGATDIDDNKADFSNFGPCVDVYAPGASIVVASHTGGLTLKSGTSFSTPLVAGMIAAIISSTGNMSPADMKKRIIADATGKVVNFATFANSHNRLALMDPSTTNFIDLKKKAS